MTDATILTGDGRPTVRLERQLVDPPSVVWRALTERDQLHSWFPCDVIVAGGEWIVGATISFPFPPEIIVMTLTGEVLECDEPSRLAFSWGTDILRFELTESGSGTRCHPPPSWDHPFATSMGPPRPRSQPADLMLADHCDPCQSVVR